MSIKLTGVRSVVKLTGVRRLTLHLIGKISGTFTAQTWELDFSKDTNSMYVALF